MDIGNLVLWGIGIIVTIILGLRGYQAYQTYRKVQRQKVSGRSVGIQAGRDISNLTVKDDKSKAERD